MNCILCLNDLQLHSLPVKNTTWHKLCSSNSPAKSPAPHHYCPTNRAVPSAGWREGQIFAPVRHEERIQRNSAPTRPQTHTVHHMVKFRTARGFTVNSRYTSYCWKAHTWVSACAFKQGQSDFPTEHEEQWRQQRLHSPGENSVSARCHHSLQLLLLLLSLCSGWQTASGALPPPSGHRYTFVFI